MNKLILRKVNQKFTEEELDFIVNYDIKYRMGKELDNYIAGKSEL